MTDKHTPGEELPIGVWLRDGELVYELEPHVDGIGRTVTRNRFEIWVQSANKSLSSEECEALAASIVSMNRSYDALLAACKEALREEHKFSVALSETLRAALALAEAAQ